MPVSTDKPLFLPIPPLDPAKRAKAIRDAIAKRKIKRTDETDSILVPLDQIAALEEKVSSR
jgi:hypothetical protein